MAHATTTDDGPRLLAAVREMMSAAGAADEQHIAPFCVNGHTLYLKTLTAERLAALYQWREANRGDVVGLMTRAIAASVCDQDGNTRLTVDAVDRLPDRVMVALADEIVKLNRMGEG